MTHPTCPDIGNLQSLLEDRAGGDESVDLVAHLETCADCQQTLETLAADPGAWEDAARGLEKRVRKEAALRGVVERLKSDEFRAAEDDLSFLRPADKPGLLGMLGPYEVEQGIGRGGMGVVLKARDPALNRVVALKVLSPHLAASRAARLRFTREGRSAAAVCHEHIVTIHSVNEADGLPYLVMQYVAGESLQDRLDRGGPLEVEEIVRIGAQTASGLAAAHAHKLIHRDIKPANLLLEARDEGPGAGGEMVFLAPRVKITDFGLARMTDDVRLTQNGMLTGTPEYMAPEQARGEPVDHRADLFSLGSVLYAMSTGVSPFRGPTTLALIRQVSEETPKSMRTLNPDVPAWLEELVARLMAKEPTERFQSAAEVAALLDGYLAHLKQPATAPVPELPYRAKPNAAQRTARRLTVLSAGIPALLLPIVVFLCVWACWPTSYLDTSLGHRWISGITEAGFYQDENDGAGPFRWTNGKATIVIPLKDHDRPQSLLVQLDRPQDRWLQITVNNREVLKEKGGVREEAVSWEKIIDLSRFELGKEVIVEIASGTRPEPTDASRGGLGVRVRGITLLSQRGDEKMKRARSSFVNVMLGNQPVGGVEESGFEEAERGQDGLFRWTKGKGRLVIPLDAKVRPKAILVQLGWPRTRSLRITANDHELCDEKASDKRPPWFWERTFDVSGIDFGDKITLEIISNTQPLLAQPNGEIDPRELGVAVLGIKLLGTKSGGTP